MVDRYFEVGADRAAELLVPCAFFSRLFKIRIEVIGTVVDALALGGVEGAAGGEHDGLAAVFKVGEQPGLEQLGVVDGQLCHHVEGALGL